jgi:membrane-associated phospholipid phosphatase
MFWSHISALGGLNVTAIVAVAITAWLVGARCWRLSLLWCLWFGAAMVLVCASQIAFIGWGIGVRSFDFTGFSGHSARAAAVYPVAAFLLLERRPTWMRALAVLAGTLLGAAVAVARVKVGAHSVSEAVTGFAIGWMTALLFIQQAYANRGGAPKPLLIALGLAMLLLPRSDSEFGHQWLTGLALTLAHQDRPFLRETWQPAPFRYLPPCPPEKVHLGYICS